MLIYDNNIFENESKNNYIALGSFDGLHLGHLSLVEKVKKLAKQNNGLSIVFTFKNSPVSYFSNIITREIITEVEKMKKASSRQLPPKELSEIELD